MMLLMGYQDMIAACVNVYICLYVRPTGSACQAEGVVEGGGGFGVGIGGWP